MSRRVRVRVARLPVDIRGPLRSEADNKAHPHMQIVNEKLQFLTLPYAPKTFTIAGLSASYTEATRPGRAPLVLRAGDPLPTISFEVFVGGPYHQTSVEEHLRKLRSLGAQRQRLTLAHMGRSVAASGPWRMTELTVTSQELQHGTNNITRATVALTFTRASDAATKVGPLSGGAKPSPSAIASSGSAGQLEKPRPATAAPVTTHIVKSGETLIKIAHQHYRDTSKWTIIATRNGIKKPSELQVGQKLVIPALGVSGGGGA